MPSSFICTTECRNENVKRTEQNFEAMRVESRYNGNGVLLCNDWRYLNICATDADKTCVNFLFTKVRLKFIKFLYSLTSLKLIKARKLWKTLKVF